MNHTPVMVSSSSGASGSVGDVRRATSSMPSRHSRTPALNVDGVGRNPKASVVPRNASAVKSTQAATLAASDPSAPIRARSMTAASTTARTAAPPTGRRKPRPR